MRSKFFVFAPGCLALLLGLAGNSKAQIASYPAREFASLASELCTFTPDIPSVKRAQLKGFVAAKPVGNILNDVTNYRESGGTVHVMQGDLAGRAVWLLLRSAETEQVCDLIDPAASANDYHTVIQHYADDVKSRVDEDDYLAELDPSAAPGSEDVALVYWPAPDDTAATGLIFQASRILRSGFE